MAVFPSATTWNHDFGVFFAADYRTGFGTYTPQASIDIKPKKNVQEANFYGSGLDDLSQYYLTGSTYTGAGSKTIKVEIDGTGTPDTFRWSDDEGVNWRSSGIAITAANQIITNGINVRFNATTGHTLGDYWLFTALDPDPQIWRNGDGVELAKLSKDGNFSLTGTNTAAVLRSTGGYLIGPTISGKQAHIFTDGTNTFQVDVNDLTNQFATVADVTGIIAPLYESGTNVTVTSTQSVYSVSVTNAGPVGIDWSGLSLDGTGRAEVTLRLNVTEWGGTNVTFSPSLTFDRTPEILVTGVWEFACSTIDGVTTRVRQTWPECCGWEQMTGFAGTTTYGAAGQPTFDATTDVAYVSIPNDGRIVRTVWTTYGTRYVPERGMVVDIGIPNPSGSTPEIVQAGFTNRLLQGSLIQTFVGVAPSVGSGAAVFLRIQPDGDTATWTPNGWLQAVQTRAMNANERAAYEAGWRP